MFLAYSDRSRWRTYVLLSFSDCNTCLACSKTYKWKKSLHRHVRESPECWPILLTSGNGEFIRQIQYKMLYNTKNWMDRGCDFNQLLSIKRLLMTRIDFIVIFEIFFIKINLILLWHDYAVAVFNFLSTNTRKRITHRLLIKWHFYYCSFSRRFY